MRIATLITLIPLVCLAADPKPPVVAPFKLGAIPAPKAHPAVKKHADPGPLAANAVVTDWTQFNGPNHDATSPEKPLIKTWPATGPKLLWELSKGTGYASPAIKDEHLVYQYRLGTEVRVECMHAVTGQLRWQFRYPTTYRDRYGYNDGPRSSPVIGGDWVYVYGVDGKLFCLRLQTGQLKWQRDLNAEFGVEQNFFGIGTTPLLLDGKLIINIGAPDGPCVAAFDADKGGMLWATGKQWGPSYASPVPATVHGQPRVFVLAGGESRPPTGGLISLNPTNGKIDFEFPWRSTSYESVNAANPVVVGDHVLITASYKTGAAMLKLGNDFKPTVAWKSDAFGLHWNTAVHKDGYLYGFDGRNQADLVCVEWKTGKEMWRETPSWTEKYLFKGEERSGEFDVNRGTLLYADGIYYCLGESGHLLSMELTPKGMKILSRAWLVQAPQTWALPVLSQGLLYISQNERQFTDGKAPRLLCYDIRGK
jgi:outer membrane protein assembly factor BamB